MQPENTSLPISRLAKWGIAVLVVIIVIWLAFVIFRTGRIEVSFPRANTAYTVEIVSQNTGESVRTASVEAGTSNYSTFIGSGKYEVRVFSPSRQSSSYFSVVPSLLRTIAIDAKLQNQVDREKIARNVRLCPSLSKDKELLSFGCAVGSQLERITPLSTRNYSVNSPIINERQVHSLVPYQEGSLVLAGPIDEDESSGLTILYVLNGRVSRTLDVPNSIKEGEGLYSEYSIIADKKTDSFIVTRNGGERIIRYQGLTNQNTTLINPEIPEDITSRSADIWDGNTIVMFGQTSDPSAIDEEGKQRNTPTTMKLFESGGKLNRSFSLPQGFDSGSFCGGLQYVCINDFGRLKMYTLNNTDSPSKPEVTISSIDGFTATDSGFAYWDDTGRLYGYSPSTKTANLLYQSTHHTFTKAYYSPAGIVVYTKFDGMTPEATTHLFLLSNKPSQLNRFLDDILPYKRGVSDSITDIDYYKNTVLVRALLTSYTPTTNPPYSQSEFRSKSATIKKLLAKDLSGKFNPRIVISP